MQRPKSWEAEATDLTTAKRILAIMEVQIAGFGSLNVPSHKLIEREDKRKEIADLEKRISQA